MRLFLSILVTALTVPLAAYAQAPKQVEVINDPLAVEVVNPAPASPPVRWQLVGFTAATMIGTVGPLEMARGCAATRPADSQAMVTRGSSLRVCEVRGMTLMVELAAEEGDGVASPHGSLADP